MSQIVPLKCPQCDRFLSETNGYARAVCPRCGWEIAVRSKDERLKPAQATLPGIDTKDATG